MKVLITGGAGYLGSELCIELNKRDNINEIIVFDNLNQGNYNLFLHSKINSTKVKLVKGDILDSRVLNKALDGVDVVYHMAKNNSTSEKDHHAQDQINNWGTSELADALVKNNIKQFINISSCNVYGYNSSDAKADSKVNPVSSLAHSMQRGEEHAARLFNQINTQIVRVGKLFGYGVSMNFSSIINDFIIKAHTGQRLSLHGKAEQKRAFVSVSKTVNILANMIDSKLESGYYNLVDYNKSVMDIVEETMNLYPDTEMIFTNNHIQLQSRTVEIDTRLNNLYTGKIKNLSQEIKEIKGKLDNACMYVSNKLRQQLQFNRLHKQNSKL